MMLIFGLDDSFLFRMIVTATLGCCNLVATFRLEAADLGYYCWWPNSCDHQLRLVVYPIIYKALYIPGGCLGFLLSTVVLPFQDADIWVVTPKWMVYNGKPLKNGWFGGTYVIFLNAKKATFSTWTVEFPTLPGCHQVLYNHEVSPEVPRSLLWMVGFQRSSWSEKRNRWNYEWKKGMT